MLGKALDRTDCLLGVKVVVILIDGNVDELPVEHLVPAGLELALHVRVVVYQAVQLVEQRLL